MRRILLAVLACTVVLAVGGTAVEPAAGARAQASATRLPADPSARGYIGFCDEAGHNVVGGSTSTRPFVWKAVASAGPPAEYQGTGQDAVLNIYQPRPGTQPVEWSGSGLVATSYYVNSASPSVQATYKDSTLAEFITSFPAKLDGLYVLRMYWGKRNFGIYSATYPVTVIQVHGARWHVISGGTVDCSSATRATSIEQATGVATKNDITPRAPAANQSIAPAGTPRRIASTPARVQDAAAAGGSAAADPTSRGGGTTSAAAASGSVSSTSWVLYLLLGVVVLLAAALLLSGRRRRGAASPTASEPTVSEHTVSGVEPKDRP